MHSHLLPGIDDGSPSPEVSLQLIRGMAELGYKKLITTPHVMWDIYRNTQESIQAAYNTLQSTLKSQGVPITIHAAAEYYLDEHFVQLLDSDTPLLTLKNNLVLIEFSFISSPFNLKEILFKLQIKGYQPVLAHPERYLYLSSSKGFYDELKDLGCIFQVNLLSLTPYYGKGVTELAHYLVKKNYVGLLGTDLHHQRHLEALQNAGSGLMTTVQRLLDTGGIMNHSL
ncbi:MAG: hypothetical protein INR73_10460 [Williamsia sp.]|nr:hypothetical protein [Williamsia sp.]